VAANSHEDLCKFFTSRSFLLEITNLLVTMFREYQNKYFMLDSFFLQKTVPFMRKQGRMWWW